MNERTLRPTAGMLAALLLVPLLGCEQAVRSPSPPGPASTPMGRPRPPRQGMSTRQKVVLVAGAAALYYLYNRHKNRQGAGPEGRYFLSKNGRVYYRDLKTGAFHWVDPPTQPIRVPAEEYEKVTGRPVDADDGQVIREAPAGWPPQGASGGAAR